MREMKDSGIAWIGVIPQDWEIVRTKSLYCSAKEIVGDRADDFERLALTLNGVIKRSKEDSVGLQPEKFSGYQILKKGELVFKLIDLENVATSRVGLSPYTGIVSPAYIVLSKQSRAKDLVVRYSMYHFLSMWQREIFNQMGDNGVRSSLNTKELLNIPHPFPSIYEQKRIVTFLDAQCAEIDAVLEKTRASIEEYKKLKQAVITQAVTKGIRGDRPMKNSGIEWIGDIPAEWGVVPHKRIMHKVKEICEQYNGEDIISLTVNGVVKRDLTAGGKMPTSFDGYQYVEPNDLLLCLFDIDVTPRCVGVTSPAYSRFVMYDGYYNAYYDYLLRMIDDNKVFVHLSKNLRSSLTESDFGAIKTCAPPLAEQKCIAAFLDVRCDEIDALIAKKQQYLIEIENYKKSLIYEYVTGKKEVKTSVLAD